MPLALAVNLAQPLSAPTQLRVALSDIAGFLNGHRLDQLSVGRYDALIVPGFHSKNGRWNRITKARVCWSHDLFQKGVAHHTIYSGTAISGS